MKENHTLKIAILSLGFNLAYGIYNGIIGFSSHSWWLITLCAYYIILGVTRFGVLIFNEKNKNQVASDRFIMRFTGCLLIFLSIILAGTAYLAFESERGIKYNEILMITIAVYSFTKITLAIINLIKARKNDSSPIKTLRYISFADALVSIFALQRSMLVSFGAMPVNEIQILNICTGTAVYIGVFILGIILIRGKQNGKIKYSKS
ncbi:MAG: hypothetical protein E7529_06235 [Ruminococcaceae bacterium]|nr:hypothetical protein [Oscillospiraceae bacterium]